MSKFIPMVDADGNEHIVNADWIEEIYKTGADACFIWLAVQGNCAESQDCIRLSSGYQKLKEILMEE